MLKIGLTGGIGSGKSEVGRFFAELGVPVIDADVIARHLVKIGFPAYNEIIKQFGSQVLQPDKEIDRGKLREIVFSDDTQRLKLERILHPLVRLQIKTEISSLKAKYCLIVIPLMIETDQLELVDKLVIVDVPVSLQIKRTVLRDETNTKIVQAIIDVQVDGESRRSVADYIIENSGTLDALKAKVKQLHLTLTNLNNTLVEDEIIKDNTAQSNQEEP